MIRLLARASLFTLPLIACESSAPVTPARAVSAEPAKSPAEVSVKPADAEAREARLARMGAQLRESREIAEAYAAGTLGERLQLGEMLLIDAKPPTDTEQVHYFVFDGPMASPPASLSALQEMKGAGGTSGRHILLGGADAGRPGLFREIKPGSYTACVVVGLATTAANIEWDKVAARCKPLEVTAAAASRVVVVDP